MLKSLVHTSSLTIVSSFFKSHPANTRLIKPLRYHPHQGRASSKPVDVPHRRLSAQEVCYQRMMMAQQQAAQLAAAESPKSSGTSLSGEKKRIAHRPNPRITPSPMSEKASGQNPQSAVGVLIIFFYFLDVSFC